MKRKYFLAWIPGIPIAIINGSVREFIFKLFFSELASHQLSVISFFILFGMYVWYIIPKLKLNSKAEAIKMGMFWLCLTIIFEFIFGHYVMGHAWPVLFHDYNLLKGRLWVLVLAWILFAPYLMLRLRFRQ